MSVLSDITQAVTDLLNAGSLTLPHPAVRCYVPNYDLKAQPGLRVFVVGIDQIVDLSTGTRGAANDTYTVAIGIYNQMSRTDGQITVADMDAMFGFVQQVFDLLRSNQRLPTYSDAALVDIGHKGATAFDPVALDRQDVFVSVLDLNFRLYR